MKRCFLLGKSVDARYVERRSNDVSATYVNKESPQELWPSRTIALSDFAKLLGVTRQTIHAWEWTDLAALQLGPPALLNAAMSAAILGDDFSAWPWQATAKMVYW